MSEKFVRIQDRTQDKWEDIFLALGVHKETISGKHVGCPFCGGKDRFRITDKCARGRWICNQCGHGDGFDFVKKLKNLSTFLEIKREIEPHLSDAKVKIPKPTVKVNTERYVDQWRAGQKLQGDNPATWYLRHRRLQLTPWPALRYLPKLTYWHDDKKTKSEHPAMAALFVGPDRQDVTVHFTYLDERGGKAEVPKVRKIAPGGMPKGGAVRLMPSAETMGIAEGIETALAAHQIHDVPVWAALSAGSLIKWQPPEHCKHVIVFGDHDSNYTGQSAAYSLAHRLSLEGYGVEVRVPDLEGDWNDVLMMEAA